MKGTLRERGHFGFTVSFLFREVGIVSTKTGDCIANLHFSSYASTAMSFDFGIGRCLHQIDFIRFTRS
jgi:hypothetical protein